MGSLPKIKKNFGAVVQLGLGRQIVNLEVAGSNPVGPAIPHLPVVYFGTNFPRLASDQPIGGRIKAYVLCSQSF